MQDARKNKSSLNSVVRFNGKNESNNRGLNCGDYQSDNYTIQLYNTTQWLLKAGKTAKRGFYIGILMRCRSLETLENVQNVLQVALGKDFTYTRSRVKLEDMATHSDSGTNSCPDGESLGLEIVNAWKWFKSSPNWTQVNYLLGLLTLCDTELLHMLNNLINVLIWREKRVFLQLNTEGFSDEKSKSNDPFQTGTYSDQELFIEASSLFEGVSSCSKNKKSRPREIPDNSDPSHNISWSKFEEMLHRNRRSDGSEAKSDSSEDPAFMVVFRSTTSMSGISQHIDFIRALPVNIAKMILGLLDSTMLQRCERVSKHWHYLTKEILTELSVKRKVDNQAIKLQGSSSTKLNPFYANICKVLVPTSEEEKEVVPTEVLFENEEPPPGFETVYTGIKTKAVEMEERNVYCGVFNIMVLLDREDSSRVMHHGGGRTVAVGSKDRTVRLLDTVLLKEIPPSMQGHAGSVRAVLVCEEKELVISASYDLSIRCWNLKTGEYVMMFSGHTGTINCLDLHGNHLVSGARDCKVKVWNLQTGHCCERMKFRHRNPVVCVKISSSRVLSGCEAGLVKMWDMDTADLLKVIEAHQGSVKCLFFDEFHILSGGSDGQVQAWTTYRDFQKCLMTFHHPGAVQSLSLLYLRVVTGCVDGKIRIFNFLSGECIRVIKIGTYESPVLSLQTHHHFMLVNSSSRVLLLQFAQECWDLNESSERKRRSHLRLLSRPDDLTLSGSSEPNVLSRHRRILSAPSMQGLREKLNVRRRFVMTPNVKLGREPARNRAPHVPIATTQVPLKLRSTHHSYEARDPGDPHGTRASLPSPPSHPPAPKSLHRPHSAPKPSSSSEGTFKIYTPLKSYTLDTSLPAPTCPRRSQTACGSRGISAASSPEGRNVHHAEHAGSRVEFKTPEKPRISQNSLDPFRERGGFRLKTESELEEFVQEQRRRGMPCKVKTKGVQSKERTEVGQPYTPELG